MSQQQLTQQEQLQLHQLTSGGYYYFKSNDTDAARKSMLQQQHRQTKQQQKHELSHSEQVLEGLSNLKENKILCDVTLIAEGMIFSTSLFTLFLSLI
jgi:hypothetical protein